MADRRKVLAALAEPVLLELGQGSLADVPDQVAAEALENI